MGVQAKVNIGALLSHAGLSLRSVAAEVLLYLPTDFSSAYEELWLKAHGQGILEEAEKLRVNSKRVEGRTKSDGVDTMAPAKDGKKRGAERTLGHKDEKALATKQRVDRKLRKIAREIRGEVSIPRRCTKPSCRKYADADWTHCPYDGAATEEVQNRGHK